MTYKRVGLTLIALCCSSLNLVGQEATDLNVLHRQRASQELESIIYESTQISNKSAYVKVRARAASLLWLEDRERAKEMLIELWRWIDKQDKSSFDTEDARATLLSSLFQRDAKLAKELLTTRQTDDKSTRISRSQVNRITSELIEYDPAVGAQLLDQSLTGKPSPADTALLSKLREKDVTLSDKIALHLLVIIPLQPTDLALPTIYSLNYYVFPPPPTESSTPAILSNDLLRSQYFLSAQAILLQSIQEDRRTSSGHIGNGDRSRKFFQGQLAELLAALSSQYAPNQVAQLQNLAIELSNGTSFEFAKVAQAMLQRIKNGAILTGTHYDSGKQTSNPQSEIMLALARNNFNDAKSLLNEVEMGSVKNALSKMITTAEFKYYIDKENIAEATHIARNSDDSDARVSMLAQIMRVAYKKPNDPFSTQILDECRLSLKKGDCNTTKAMAMLSLVSAAAPTSGVDTVEWLREGVKCLNVKNPAGEQDKRKITDNSLAIFITPEFQRAFSIVGRIDLDNAILAADILADSNLRLAAKLSACERWLGLENAKAGTPIRKTVKRNARANGPARLQ